MAALADRTAVDQAVQRGSDLLKQGKLDEAQAAFRAALAIDADNPRVLALLGLAHFRGNQFERARAIYEELAERLPTDASHRLNLGLVYLKLGDATKAINALEASRALDPSQGRAVSYLGLAYARAGRYVEAYRAFLIAGQRELASEIATNLTAAEREGIHATLARSSTAIPISALAAAVDAAAKPEPAHVKAAPEPAHAKATSEPAHAKATPEPAHAKPVPSAPAARATVPAHPPIEPDQPSGSIPINLEESTPALKVPASAHAPAPAPSAKPAAPASARTRPAPAPTAEPAAPLPSANPNERLSESQMFVSPFARVAAAPGAAADGRSMISRAVDSAAPAAAHSATNGPIPLSQLATEDLARPDEGDEPFEIAPGGALVIRISERVLARLDGVHVMGGDLAFERATRHSRGRQTDERFDYGGAQLHSVTGKGYLIAVPDKRAFTAVALDDDIFYLREDLVFAFEAKLRWENGNVPGLRGRLPVVQFRGDGAVALRSERPLVRVKLPPQGIVFVDAARLAGWIGRVIPRAVVPPSDSPMGDVCVECTGEGVVLIDPVGDPGMRLDTQPQPVKPRTTTPPPPPAAQSEASRSDIDFSNVLDDAPPATGPDDAPPGRDEF